MAVKSGSIWLSASVDTTGDTITPSAGAFTVYFKNTGDTNALLVNVLGVHDAGEFDTIAPGDAQEYSNDGGVVGVMIAKAGASTTSYSGSITRRHTA